MTVQHSSIRSESISANRDGDGRGLNHKGEFVFTMRG